jgi:hypothetical protein
VGACASDEVDLLNGFLRTGYDWWSICGTGGASVDLPLLNAFRIEAKDGFFENDGVPVVATEAWDECANGLAGGYRAEIFIEWFVE